MEDQLISFETAKLAKEKGFEERCRNCFLRGEPIVNGINNKTFGEPLEDITQRPTQTYLQRWLREKHNIDIDCSCDYERENWFCGYRKKGLTYNHLPITYSSYEEALEKKFTRNTKTYIMETIKDKFKQFLIDNGAYEKFIERIKKEEDYKDFNECIESSLKSGVNELLLVSIEWSNDADFWNKLDKKWRKKHRFHKLWYNLFFVEFNL